MVKTIRATIENPNAQTYEPITASKFKNFILGIKFIKEELNAAYKHGGIAAFPKAQKDILETMRDDLDKQAEELADKKLADLLSPVDWRKVVTVDKQRNIIFIGGEQVDPGKRDNLRAEAEFFAQSELWQLLQETPKDLAQRAMFVSSESLVDLQKGKSMLYHLSAQKNIVELFKAKK